MKSQPEGETAHQKVNSPKRSHGKNICTLDQVTSYTTTFQLALKGMELTQVSLQYTLWGGIQVQQCNLFSEIEDPQKNMGTEWYRRKAQGGIIDTEWHPIKSIYSIACKYMQQYM